MRYTAIFTQHYVYEIDADNEHQAFQLAHKEFYRDVYSSIANTVYDEVEIICEEDDE